MRQLRAWRHAAVILGLILGIANPATVLAHAHAHAHQVSKHLITDDSHDGPTQLKKAGNPDHQHVRIDHGTKSQSNILAVAVISAPAPDLAFANKVRNAAPPAAATPSNLFAHELPRLRAPPTR